MIFVLGLSLVIVNISSLVNNKEGYKNKNDENDENDEKDEKDEKEGFDEDDEKEVFDEDDEKEVFDEDDQDEKLKKLKKLNKSKVVEDEEDSIFMQDKELIKKIKKLDPNIFNTIKNLNSVDIDKINKTINKLTNKVKDP